MEQDTWAARPLLAPHTHRRGVVPDSGPYLRESIWASKTDTAVNANTDVSACAWSNHILYLMRCCWYKSTHHTHEDRAEEDVPFENILVKCVYVCVFRACAVVSVFSFYSLTAACLAGTVMMVVSTGWLLGNNYLTVLCLHWITQWVVWMCVHVCMCRGMEKYSKIDYQAVFPLLGRKYPTSVMIASAEHCFWISFAPWVVFTLWHIYQWEYFWMVAFQHWCWQIMHQSQVGLDDDVVTMGRMLPCFKSIFTSSPASLLRLFFSQTLSLSVALPVSLSWLLKMWTLKSEAHLRVCLKYYTLLSRLCCRYEADSRCKFVWHKNFCTTNKKYRVCYLNPQAAQSFS